MRALLFFICTSSVVFAATDKQACMYCKRADTNAGFMTNFAYCGDSQDETCIKDFWEYINPTKLCISTVKDGWTLDIDEDCKAEEATAGTCPTELISSEFMYGKDAITRTVILGENTKCTIMVDASTAVARVTFGGTNNLGVLYPSYILGQPLTV